MIRWRLTRSWDALVAQRALAGDDALAEILAASNAPGVISFSGGLPSPETFPWEALAEVVGRAGRGARRLGAPVPADAGPRLDAGVAARAGRADRRRRARRGRADGDERRHRGARLHRQGLPRARRPRRLRAPDLPRRDQRLPPPRRAARDRAGGRGRHAGRRARGAARERRAAEARLHDPGPPEPGRGVARAGAAGRARRAWRAGTASSSSRTWPTASSASTAGSSRASGRARRRRSSSSAPSRRRSSPARGSAGRSARPRSSRGSRGRSRRATRAPARSRRGIAEELGRSGRLEAQIEHSRAFYERRWQLTRASLEAHLGEVATWVEPAGGFFTWLTLQVPGDTTELARRAIEAGVAFVPGRPFYADGGGADSLRLAFSLAPEERIDEGVERLANLIGGG